VPCEHTQLELHGYLDGELDAMGAANFEKHLADCPDCKRVLAAEESLRAALQKAALYERAPGSLRQNLLGAAREKVTPMRPARTPGFSWQWLAAAAVLLLAFAISWRQWQHAQSPSSMQIVASSLVDAHLRSLQPGHLTDVESTDQHTVKPWFDGRLDFAPPVHDFSPDGFPLLGGRLDVVEGRTVAALVYGRRKHIINVFVEKTPSGDTWNGFGNMQGYHWLAWQKDGFSFFAVSDVSAPDLNQLEQLIVLP
jgi:mycothiol system anti-sigma-R factor